VKKSAAFLAEMDRWAPGRAVPVVVRGKEVTVGWGGT
jgi:hypothetical protein